MNLGIYGEQGQSPSLESCAQKRYFFYFLVCSPSVLAKRALQHRLVLLVVSVSNMSNWVNGHVRAKQSPDGHVPLCSSSGDSELQGGGWRSALEPPVGSFQVARVHSPLPFPSHSLDIPSDSSIEVFLQVSPPWHY